MCAVLAQVGAGTRFTFVGCHTHAFLTSIALAFGIGIAVVA